MDSLLELDRTLFVLVNSGFSNAVLDVVFAGLSWVGQGYMLAILGAIWLALFDRRRFPKNFLVYAAILLLLGQVVQGAKRTINKPRPLGDAALVKDLPPDFQYTYSLIRLTRTDYRYPEMSPYSRIGDGTFHLVGRTLSKRGLPSGHTAAAFGFALCMIYGGRRRVRYLWLLFASGVALSRMYVGVHFPLDLAGGLLLGLPIPYVLLRWTEKYHGLGARKRKSRGVPRPEPTVMIVAGEASADIYGANLIRALKLLDPALQVFGVGGERMVEAGLDRVHDSNELSIVGFTGAVAAAHRVRKIYNDLLAQMRQRKPHVLITIDLPDFNLMLASQAQSAGVRVVYYISPQVWAWRRGRIKTIAERVDRMVVAFPFEKELYEQAGVNAQFFGHPMLETLESSFRSDEEAFTHLGLDRDRKVFIMAPGSRPNEIKYITRSLFEAGGKLQKALNDWQFVIPMAPNVDEDELKSVAETASFSPIFIKDRFHDLLNLASFGIITSGTATLEAALFRCPMLIVYKGHPVNVAIAKRLIKIDSIGLPNIIVGKKLFPEILQEQATGENLAEQALTIVNDPTRYAAMLASCDRVRDALSGGDTSTQIAQMVYDLIESEIHGASHKKT